MEFDKLFEGVELSDVESENLSAQKTALTAKVAELTAALKNANVALVAADQALEERAGLPSVLDRAKDIAEQLEKVGCNHAAIRAAIVTQFGKRAPAAAKAAKSPSAGGAKDKKITIGLPSDADADRILSAVRASGTEGIRMETLYDTFTDVAADASAARTAVFGTVKNALFDKRVLSVGQARGMRYVWVDAPAASPEPPAAQ